MNVIVIKCSTTIRYCVSGWCYTVRTILFNTLSVAFCWTSCRRTIPPNCWTLLHASRCRVLGVAFMVRRNTTGSRFYLLIFRLPTLGRTMKLTLNKQCKFRDNYRNTNVRFNICSVYLFYNDCASSFFCRFCFVCQSFWVSSFIHVV